MDDSVAALLEKMKEGLPSRVTGAAHTETRAAAEPLWAGSKSFALELKRWYPSWHVNSEEFLPKCSRLRIGRPYGYSLCEHAVACTFTITGTRCWVPRRRFYTHRPRTSGSRVCRPVRICVALEVKRYVN